VSQSEPFFLSGVSLATLLDAFSRCPDHFAAVDRAMRGQGLRWEDSRLGDLITAFCPSSVWLSDFGVSLVVTRILFPQRWVGSALIDGSISFILLELFDENWRASPGTLRVPFSLDGRVSYRNLTFPTCLNVSSSGTFDGMEWSTSSYNGEDPRVSLRRLSSGLLEPVITFSASVSVSSKEGRRGTIKVGAAFPFSGKVTIFLVANAPGCEKNWVILDVNGTHADMIRAFDPFKVISCDLNSGFCIDSDAGSQFSQAGPMRPGTHMIEIERDVFVGWARTHLEGCSCSIRFYRPHLVVIRRSGTNYTVTDISGPFDFTLSGSEQPGFGGCVGRDSHMNGVIPSGIADWDSSSMTILIYRQDRDRILVKMCGILNWVRELIEKPMHFKSDALVIGCATEAGRKECQKYS
jgi:beta-1,2-mannosyltransferase